MWHLCRAGGDTSGRRNKNHVRQVIAVLPAPGLIQKLVFGATDDGLVSGRKRTKADGRPRVMVKALMRALGACSLRARIRSITLVLK